MFPIAKFLTATVIVPGTTTTYFLILREMTPSPEHINVLLAKGQGLGDCKLGLTKSFREKTGGFLEDAERSDFNKGSAGHLKRLIKFFSDEKTNKKEIDEIKNACQNGAIVELAGNAGERKGKKDTNGGDNDHKPL